MHPLDFAWSSRRHVRRFITALVVMSSMWAGQTLAAGPVYCAAATTVGGVNFTPVSPPHAMRVIQSVSPYQSHWLSPGFQVARENFQSRVFCFGDGLGTTHVPIFLKINPTAAYIEALKENGLDVRVQSNSEAKSEEIMLLRDGVQPGVGRMVPLERFRAVDYQRNSGRPFEASGDYRVVVPWISLDVDFVVMNPEKKNENSIQTLLTPYGSGLSLKIMAAGHEGTAMEVLPIQNRTQYQFGTCAPPIIKIDRTGTNRADIDFGFVPLDELKKGMATQYEQRFQIELVQPTRNRSCAGIGDRKPKLRFTSAGFYRNGMFEGDAANAAYPGNSVVAIQLSDGTNAIFGANHGDINPGSFIPFYGSTLTKSFTAAVRYKTGANADRVGPFLIPVTLEAFYH
jgi:type 1 fimbria pilin